MDVFKLEIAQMLKEHPTLHEKENYKCKYINVLEYFVRKFSPEDKWATATLALYKKALLEKPQDYKYEGFTLSEQSKTVVATKFKPFKFFSYRYCVIVDCIYINAINFTLNYQAFIISGIRKESVKCLMVCLILMCLWMNLNKSAILRIAGERIMTF